MGFHLLSRFSTLTCPGTVEQAQGSLALHVNHRTSAMKLHEAHGVAGGLDSVARSLTFDASRVGNVDQPLAIILAWDLDECWGVLSAHKVIGIVTAEGDALPGRYIDTSGKAGHHTSDERDQVTAADREN